MTKEEIIDQILNPAFEIGLLKANNRENYINIHCKKGITFIEKCNEQSINKFNDLVNILKKFGYWTDDRRYIGQYTKQPDPYSDNAHICVRKNRIDIARICFVENSTAANYFGVSVMKASFIDTHNHPITNTYNRPSPAHHRWAPKNMDDFLSHPEEYLLNKNSSNNKK